jgi:hypothetical protein
MSFRFACLIASSGIDLRLQISARATHVGNQLSQELCEPLLMVERHGLVTRDVSAEGPRVSPQDDADMMNAEMTLGDALGKQLRRTARFLAFSVVGHGKVRSSRTGPFASPIPL